MSYVCRIGFICTWNLANISHLIDLKMPVAVARHDFKWVQISMIWLGAWKVDNITTGFTLILNNMCLDVYCNNITTIRLVWFWKPVYLCISQACPWNVFSAIQVLTTDWAECYIVYIIHHEHVFNYVIWS